MYIYKPDTKQQHKPEQTTQTTIWTYVLRPKFYLKMGTPPKPIISSTFSTIGRDTTIYIYETSSSSSSSSPLLFVNPEISYELNKKKHCLQGTDGNGDHPTTTFEQLAEVACSLFWGLPGFPFLGTGWVVIWTKTFSSNVVNGKNTAEFEGTCVQSWCSHIKMFKLFWVTIVYNQSIIRVYGGGSKG